MTNKDKKHIEECIVLEHRFGPSAVYNYANENGITDWRNCPNCNASTPVVDNSCLVCGSDLTNLSHTTEDNSNIDELYKEDYPNPDILSFMAMVNGEESEFTAYKRTDPSFPGLEVRFNGIIVAIIEYNSVKKEVQTVAYTGNNDEPTSITLFKKMK